MGDDVLKSAVEQELEAQQMAGIDPELIITIIRSIILLLQQIRNR